MKLRLAHHKTEVAVVNNRKSKERALFSVSDCAIESMRSLRHLGIVIDAQLRYARHVDYACKRTSTAIAALL